MKRIILLTITSMVALCGCKSTGETIPSPTPIISQATIAPLTSTPNPRDDELTQENVTLRAENKQLQETIDEYKNEAMKLAQFGPINPSIEKYPQLANFNSIQKWKSITIISRQGQDTVSITDPELLETVGNLFMIKHESQGIPNGALFSMDPFSLKLTNSEGTFLMDVVQHEVVTFPEIAPGVYFDVRISDIISFGQAFMKKPSYVPTESTESRMLNSELIYVIEDKYHYYMPKWRGRLIFIQFIEAEKKKIEKPAAIPSKPLEDISFFLYGNKIQMKVYPGSIEITDGTQITWYEVGKSTAGDIHATISAN
jgi:hypothetical protein